MICDKRAINNVYYHNPVSDQKVSRASYPRIRNCFKIVQQKCLDPNPSISSIEIGGCLMMHGNDDGTVQDASSYFVGYELFELV
jgi:hypothetical protein